MAASTKTSTRRGPKASAPKATPEAKAPESTTPEQEKAEAPKATKADLEKTFEQAFGQATEAEEVEADLRSALVEALRAVGGPKAREALVSRVVASVATEALQATKADGTPAPDVDRAQRATALGSDLRSVLSAPAPERGPDPAEVLAARALAVGTLAREVVAWGRAQGLDVDSVGPDLLKVADGTPEKADLGEAFQKAFGRKAPDVEKVPGRRSGGGGGGQAARPSDALDSVAVGTVLTFEYKGRTFEGSVVESDGRHAVEFEGTSYRSPTKAATSAISTHPEAPAAPSVNGWDTWKVQASGATLAQHYAQQVA